MTSSELQITFNEVAFNQAVKIGKRLTPADVHVDRNETAFSYAIMQDAEDLVASQVFPAIPVRYRSGQYRTFDQSYWLKSQMRVQGPGAMSHPMEWAMSSASYTIPVIGGHTNLDDQTEANADEDLDLRADNTTFLTEQGLLYREIDWATNFFTTGVWTTDYTPSTKWDQTNSTPIDDIENAINAIRVGQSSPTVHTATAKRANTLVFGFGAWSRFRRHEDVLGRINLQNGVTMATRALVAQLFEVDRVLVTGGVKNTADLGQTGSYSTIGDTESVWVGYVAPRPGRKTASAGYTLTWAGFLGSNAEGGRINTWYSNDSHTWRQEIQLAYKFVKIAADLGYLIYNVLT